MPIIIIAEYFDTLKMLEDDNNVTKIVFDIIRVSQEYSGFD